MKKFLTFVLLCLTGIAVWAQNPVTNVNATFSNTGTSWAGVNITVAATDASNAAVSGVTATVNDPNTAPKTVSSPGTNCIVINKNSNAMSNEPLNFTIFGLPAGSKFNRINLPMYAITGGGGFQQNAGQSDVTFVVTVKEGDNTLYTGTVTNFNVPQIQKGNLNDLLVFNSTDDIVTSGGDLQVNFSISKGTVNNGMCMAFQSLRLSYIGDVQYTVNITGADGSVTYNSTSYNDGDKITASELTVDQLTATPVEGYTVNVAIDGTDINVTYTPYPTYTISVTGNPSPVKVTYNSVEYETSLTAPPTLAATDLSATEIEGYTAEITIDGTTINVVYTANSAIPATIVKTYDDAGTPMSYSNFLALAGTGKHFGLMAVSENGDTYKKWFGFTSATSRVSEITSAQVFSLTGTTGNYSVVRYSDGTAAQSALKIVNRTAGDYAPEYTPDMSISFDNASGGHFNANSYGFAAGTGGWSAYVAYGPFYVVTVDYKTLDDAVVATKNLIVTAGNLTIDEAPSTAYVVTEAAQLYVGNDCTATVRVALNLQTYDVVVEGAAEGKLIYNESEYGNGDSFEGAGITVTDVAAKDVAGYVGSVNIDGTTITVTYTAISYTFETSSAPVSGEWQNGTKFYTIKEKRQGYLYASKIPAITDKTTPTTDDGKWAVIANGSYFQFMNKATQEVLTFAGTENDALASTTDDLTDPYSLIDVVTYLNPSFEGGYECFKIADAEAYPNDKGIGLAVWNSNQALWGWGGSQANPKNGDDGSKFQFTLVETLGEVNWAALELAINNAKKYTVGHGLGEYSWIEYGEDYTDSWGDTFGYYEDFLAAREGDAFTVEYMTDLLNEVVANEFVLNMPKPGTFLRVKGAASGNYIAGDNSVSNGRAAMTASKDASSILYYTAGGELIGYQSGLGFIDTFHRATVGSTFEHHTFSESSYGNKGAYTLQSDFASGSQVFYDGTTDVNRNSAANSLNCAWYLEEVTELPVTVTSAGYATLYAPVNLTIPTGVKAYGMTVANEKYLSPEEIDTTIPANTGVVLEAAEGTYNFAITTNAGSATSVLNGTYATIASAETDGNYVFSIKDGTPGFYKFVGSELKGFKAYYQTSVASINGFSIDFGGQTVGVNSVISATNLKAGYDIQGRMINKMQKGINVINGKKIIK